MQVVLWSLADHVTNLSIHDQGTFDGKREKLSSRLTLKVSTACQEHLYLHSRFADKLMSHPSARLVALTGYFADLHST